MWYGSLIFCFLVCMFPTTFLNPAGQKPCFSYLFLDSPGLPQWACSTLLTKMYWAVSARFCSKFYIYYLISSLKQTYEVGSVIFRFILQMRKPRPSQGGFLSTNPTGSDSKCWSQDLNPRQCDRSTLAHLAQCLIPPPPWQFSTRKFYLNLNSP